MITAAELFRGQPLVGCNCPATLTGLSRDSRLVAPGEAYVVTAEGEAGDRHAAEAIARHAGVVVHAPWERGRLARTDADRSDDDATSRAGGAESQPVTRPVGTTHGDAGEAPALPGAGGAPALPGLETPHARWSFARASAALHEVDRLAIPLIGVTGTKGKTTVTHLVHACLGSGSARIGTTGWHDGVSERPNSQTTPPPEELHRFLAGLPATCPGVALEVSSHGCDQFRLAGLRLAALAYTGLGHDHLDYHQTIGAYLGAKLRAVQLLVPGGLLVVNADDPYAHVFAHAGVCHGATVVRLGFQRGEVKILGAPGTSLASERHIGAQVADARSDHRLPGIAGVSPACEPRAGETPAIPGSRSGSGTWTLAGQPLPVALPGRFNAWNAAAAAILSTVTGGSTGIDLATALARLATAPAVPGRMERLADAPATYVDYAHTPESIANAIAALREAHPGARLVIAFGCGGDRDTSKRAPMGAAASAADAVVITTDNSRSEDPAAIAAQIDLGITPGTLVEVIAERGAAILRARDLAGPEGVVLIAGKGHETSQTIQGVTTAWDDRAFVRGFAGPQTPDPRPQTDA